MLKRIPLFRHNFHTHTHYCDGSSAPEEYIRAALDAQLLSLGFSSHAPVPFENQFAIPDHEQLAAYVAEIRALEEKYAGQIRVYLALEADYIPGVTTAFSKFKQDYGLDYIIGSVHMVRNMGEEFWFIDGPDRSVWEEGLENDFGKDIRKAVTTYYRQLNEMIEKQQPDIVGHLDKIKMHNQDRYFSESEPWYRALVSESLELIRKCGSIVEVNTRGLYKKRSNALFPGKEILKEMHGLKIPVTISSDAHDPSEIILAYDVAENTLQDCGYKDVMVYTGSGWEACALA